MDKQKLYDDLSERKFKPKDLEPYVGGNGRVDKCVQLIRQGKLRSGGTLLDVGGAIGDLGYATEDIFERRIVFDISEKFLDAARTKGNETWVGDVDCTGLRYYDDQTIDLVTALDFIEHIIDPENFARECHRVLKRDGQVFINTPNIRFWPHVAELLYHGTFPHTSGDREVFHGGHLAFYTFKDLCKIFGDAGFSGFEMVMDQEGYKEPPRKILDDVGYGDQRGYVQLCMELGCPNLLFIARKS